MDENNLKSNKNKKSNNIEKFPISNYVLLGILLFSILIYVIAIISPTFADFYNGTVGAFVRAILAYATYIFPFSVGEIIIISLPIIITLIIVFAYKKHSKSTKSMIKYIISLILCTSMLFSVFVLGFGCGYHGSTLDQKLMIEKEKVSKEDLFETAIWLTTQVNEYSSKVEYAENNFSIMPYSLKELNSKLMYAYDKACEKYDFIQKLHSKVKPVMLSKLMSYTHITGVYTYFTGEANININFPDYTIPYTAAHELAHQRGIAREDEANFVAFLVCIESDDNYIRYSGYLNLYEYVMNALYSYKEEYKIAYEKTVNAVINERKAYSKFFDKYRHSTAGKVSESVNDAYLQMQGTEGTKSYGMVVDLAVAYKKSKIS